MDKRERRVQGSWNGTAWRMWLASVALAAAVAAFCLPAAAQLSDPLQNIGVRPDLLKNVGVDQQAGVVRLPVDRAMDLILERGLPTRAPSAAPPGSSTEAEAPFLPVTQDAQGQCSFVEDQRISEAPIE